MKIAIVGKGGSGKSTISTLLALEYARQGKQVLAIDADYNMDFAHNLGREESQKANFLNQSGNSFYEYLDLEQQKIGPYIGTKEFKNFSFNPPDSFTSGYTQEIKKNIHLMICGDFHDEMLYGDKCNHSFIKPLKLYIPLIKKDPHNDVVLVDSVAGTDMLSFGLYLGVDVLIVVVENNRNSIGVALQLQKIAQEYTIPLFFIVNKRVANQDNTQLINTLQEKNILGYLSSDEGLLQSDYSLISKKTNEEIQNCIKILDEKKLPLDAGMQRHLLRKKKHEQFITKHH